MNDKAFKFARQVWLEDHWHSSVPTSVDDRSFRFIINELGEDAIPFILWDLENDPQWWFAVLSKITGWYPQYPPEVVGKNRELSKFWSKHLRDLGYKPEPY